MSKIQRTAVLIILILASAAIIYPIFYAFASAMMTSAEIDSYPPHIFPSGFNLDNYKSVFAVVPVAQFLLNSFVVAIAITVGHLITASFAAYAFAFIRFPLKSFFFALFLATIMIPWEVTMIPNFLTIRSWGWTDSYWGLILPFLATGFGTFLFRQFFMQLPKDIFEAAKMDGMGHFGIFLRIALPLTRSASVTLAVYSFIGAWNMYLWPLLITNEESMRTVQIGVTMLQFEDFTSWNLVLAGLALMMLPPLLLLVLGLKQLVGNLTMGALKG
ncbi:carbohydrate ABC transporter permease [Paenibacillus lupini]|uniref:carbohydrate ABC transporter permease n=1 Tax=Paenibacillus lupini TaxID=1450204 RepID=UPI0014217B73|nr:carbohydrate ABC transporter permease [Paenibacillus lupini]NIK23044.1 ABC-type glycerol-3-phosphate transport system permease component [Paenibacillus lupini]